MSSVVLAVCDKIIIKTTWTMGSIFSRKRQPPVRPPRRTDKRQTIGQKTVNQPSVQDEIMNSMNCPPLLRDTDSFIQDLSEFGAKLDQLEQLLSGHLLIPTDVAAEALGIDSDDCESYVAVLKYKADQLKNTMLFITKYPHIPNAGLMMELLKDVEPKCSAMSKKLLCERNTLTMSRKDEGHQSGSTDVPTQGQSNSGHIRAETIGGVQSPQPGPSAAYGLSRPSTSGSNVRGNTIQPTSSAESRGLSLIYSQSDSSSSSNTGSDLEDSDESHSTEHKSLCSQNQKLQSLKDWQDEHLINRPKRINVDRSHNILDSALTLYGSMSSKSFQRIAAVKFSGEEGSDMGALTREYFFIAFEAVISGTFKGQKLMVGQRGHLIPNAMVDGRAFFSLGQMIVHAVINGSRGVCGISPAIIQYLVGDTHLTQLEDSHPPLSVEDVDDIQLKQLLEKYDNGENFTEEEEESWLSLMAESNCSVNWRKKDTRNYVVQHLLLNFVFWKRLRQIQSLEEGLKCAGLKQFLISNPSDANISEVFPSGDNLAYSADAVAQIIITRGDDFDPEILQFFLQFLKELHDQNIDEFRLRDLIQFVTSSPYFPEKLVVSFDKDKALPVARACFCEIVLPAGHETYPKFREAMVAALQNGITGFQLH